MSNLARKIQRENERKELQEKKIKEQEIAMNHPAVKYTEELLEEIKQLHKTHPEIQMYHKKQIELIREKFESEIKKQTETKQEVINEILKKTEALLQQVESDYKDKEIWSLMRAMELERDEIKDIAKSYETENETSEQILVG